MVTIREITRATPTILRVLVIDEQFIRYPLVELAEVDPSHPTTAWVQRTNPYTEQVAYCRVIGDGTWLQFEEGIPTNFLDRTAADIHTNYPSLGGVSPIAVHRKSYANDQGDSQAQTRSINCRHELFIVYDGVIPDGSYDFNVTGGFLPNTPFVVSENMRCDTIRATQYGHKPTDPEKVGAMSLWIPEYGVEGAVDLSLVGQDFHIINAAGATVFTGTISLRIGPTTQEDASGVGVPLTRYPSTTTPPQRCTAQVTKGNPTTFTLTGHGYSSGQFKYFSGFSGLNDQFIAQSYEITVTGPNTFTVAVDSTGFTDHTFGAYLNAYDSQVYDTHLANKGATYIYDLDYSAFQPTAGNYGKHRIYVPGYGVSWPFEVDPAARYEAAKNSVKGYTSQCWGMPLSASQAGWNRPAQYRDGKRGQRVFESTKPGCIDGEGGYFGAIRDDNMDPKWRTTNRVTDWFGCYSDAGDWDFHIWRHADSLYQLLDMAYDFVPIGQRNTDYGFPRSSNTIDQDLYGSIDGLGCPVHMAIWYLEPLRRTQHVDGWVYAGCQYTDGPEDTTTTPSWLSQNDMYVLAADHQATFYYAWVAAKLGRILKDAGATTLGDMWIASAESAYAWADAIWEDWDTNGIASTGAWRDWYITTLNFQSIGGYSNADVTSTMNAQNAQINDKTTQTRGIRIVAATALWRAKGGLNDAYNAVILAATAGIQQSGVDAYGAWEYINGPDLGDNTANRTIMENGINGRVDAQHDGQMADEFCYKNRNAFDEATDDVQPNNAGYYAFWPWQRQRPAGDFTKYLELICAAEDYVGGRNQQGMSFTTGLGFNPPCPILVRDQERSNVAPTPGYTIYVRYGPAGAVELQYTFGGMKRFPATTAEITQSVYPIWDAFPLHEQHTRNTLSIYSTEFTTNIHIVGRICNLIWLHTWDGTGTLELANAPKPGVLSL